MRPALAAVIVLVILLLAGGVAAYGWYNYTGWKTFAYKSGDKPSWASATGKTKDLRFKNAVFTLAFPPGAAQESPQSWSVTAVLNGMARAYAPAATGARVPGAAGVLTLRGIDAKGAPVQVPLNPFSFIKTGVNDAKNAQSPDGTVADPRAAPWPKVAVVLTGKYRTI